MFLRLLFSFLILLLTSRVDAQVADTTQTWVPRLPTDSLILEGNYIDTPITTVPDKADVFYEFAGVVLDKNTGEGIPFATIFFPGSDKGVSADLNGSFSLKVAQLPNDTLIVKAIGFIPYRKILRKDKFLYELFIELAREDNLLDEYVFKPGEDPAVTLLKNIIREKPNNNPDKVNNYSRKNYLLLLVQ